MKTQIFFTSLVVALSISACQQEELGYVPNPSNSNTILVTPEEYCFLREQYSGSTKISQSEAETIALDFANDFSGNKNIAIEDVKCLTNPSNEISKAYSKSQVEDTLLYFVNFAGNNGYALIAADYRLPAKILAYSCEGDIDTTDIIGLSFILNGVEDYYEEQFQKYELQKNEIAKSLEYKINGVCEFNNSISKKKKVDTPVIKTISTSPWVQTKSIGPLVPVTWSQKGEYNDILQKVKGKDRCLGCVSLATAQLMAYWKYPSHLTCNGIGINWDTIVYQPSILNTSENAKCQIQSLCYLLSGFCHTHYFKKQSMALPKHSLDVLDDFGYHVPNGFVQYKKARVLANMDNRRPIIAWGQNKKTKKLSRWISILSSGIINVAIPQHVWLIDGYMVFTQTTTITTYRNVPTRNHLRGTNTQSYTTTQTQEYIHMNWGWGTNASKCWYLPDVFDCSKAFKYDNGVIGSDTLSLKEKYNKVHIAQDIYPN